MNQIAQIRRQRGLTQSQVARALHVSGPTVCDWESGKKNPNHAHLLALARLLQVTTDTLLGLRPAPPLRGVAGFGLREPFGLSSPSVRFAHPSMRPVPEDKPTREKEARVAARTTPEQGTITIYPHARAATQPPATAAGRDGFPPAEGATPACCAYVRRAATHELTTREGETTMPKCILPYVLPPETHQTSHLTVRTDVLEQLAKISEKTRQPMSQVANKMIQFALNNLSYEPVDAVPKTPVDEDGYRLPLEHLRVSPTIMREVRKLSMKTQLSICEVATRLIRFGMENLTLQPVDLYEMTFAPRVELEDEEEE